MSLHVIVLAAGQGKRMHSSLPKVLHPLAGRPLLAHVLDTARTLGPQSIVVVHGHGGDAVRSAFPGNDLRWVEQPQQLGTGHAVAEALPSVPADAQVLVLNGDVPLAPTEMLGRLVDVARGGLAIATSDLSDPSGYGRVVRDASGRVRRIVEHRDASAQELAIPEWYAGFLAAPARSLARWVEGLTSENAQKEYYLTDVVELAVGDGVEVQAVKARDRWDVAGVNSKRELAAVERELQRRAAERLLEAGVTLADPARVDVRGSLECGRDVSIDLNCVFEGNVRIGDGARIGPNCVLRDVTIAEGTEILGFCFLQEAEIGARCRIGPFARLRPGASLAQDVHIGNFVEVKASRIGAGSKANHLSYIGDSQVGARVNVGAGTITCNYDGANKHRTVIEDDCFIGSDATLVAPVTIARGSYIGAGSTISKDTPSNQLTVARARQVSLPSWKAPRKKG
jgi:bifunctional UDP-N-acetylglucosamine pyrophosphorylase/glucosamine-1-phosphate N-acetyltransferase